MSKPEKHVFICTQSRLDGHPRPSCGQKDAAAVAEEFFWHLQQSQQFGRIQCWKFTA